jgi:RNA polymerase sigma-70 factor (ECF subfamily)
MSDPLHDTSNPVDLDRLLQRMSGRDELAFEQLHAATRRKLFSTVLLIVKRRHLAEEVVQEAYVRIWLNAAAYRSALGSPMTWIITIARNLAIDVMRKPAWEVYSDQSAWLDFPADGPTALESIELREHETDTVKLQQSIASALQALDPARRHLVIAAYIHGESRHQLSEQYGVPVNTIKTWIRRALLEVRAQIETAPSRRDGLGLMASGLSY